MNSAKDRRRRREDPARQRRAQQRAEEEARLQAEAEIIVKDIFSSPEKLRAFTRHVLEDRLSKRDRLSIYNCVMRLKEQTRIEWTVKDTLALAMGACSIRDGESDSAEYPHASGLIIYISLRDGDLVFRDDVGPPPAMREIH